MSAEGPLSGGKADINRTIPDSLHTPCGITRHPKLGS
jgi:hypothetical protein